MSKSVTKTEKPKPGKPNLISRFGRPIGFKNLDHLKPKTQGEKVTGFDPARFKTQHKG